MDTGIDIVICNGMKTYPQKSCKRCDAIHNARIIDSNNGLCDDCRDTDYRNKNYTKEQWQRYHARQRLYNAPLSKELQKEINAGVDHLIRRGAIGMLD